MTNILLIKSSPRGGASVSSQLGEELVQQLKEQHPGAVVKVRDLASQPAPHITPDYIGGVFKPADQRSEQESQLVGYGDELIDELEWANHIVVSSGMINFSIPSTLKAWLDHVVRVGRTVQYTADGPVGQLGGRQLYLVLASGGAYGPERQAWEFQLSYLKQIFSFIGLDEAQVFCAQGTLAPAEIAQQNIASARESILQLSLAEVGA
ncbi:NAD(P)H-dependent oxidoreductase [bacterium]|nr:NAD(P)H-dependent oxidoreductase [bacterium]